eukprot:6025476-Lingulodinium_polyedra.AAC.1
MRCPWSFLAKSGHLPFVARHPDGWDSVHKVAQLNDAVNVSSAELAYLIDEYEGIVCQQWHGHELIVKAKRCMAGVNAQEMRLR